MVNLEVESFDPKYFDVLVDLHKSQDFGNISSINLETLPKTGFMVSHTTDYAVTPIAIGFLRKVEGGYAMIDTLVTNARLPNTIRHLGVTKLVDSLIQAARDEKLTGLICMTKDAGILKRAKSLGFHVVDQSIIALPF